jgi:type I restriction enzyme S subunit
MTKNGKNGFAQVPISEFCETGSGGTPSRSKASVYFGGAIPWVKSGELRENTITETEETLTELGLQESAAKLLPRHTLLVALYGATVGRIGVLGIEAATNQAVCYIIPDERRANRKYLFYALQSQVPMWLSKRVGGGQPNISQGIIRDTLIPLPPLPEQKRIADILDKADAIRRKRREATACLDEIILSLFENIVGDPLINPHGWGMTTLGDHVDFVTGFAFQSSQYTDNNGVRLLRGANVLPGHVEWSDTSYWPVDDVLDDRFHLACGDVVLAMDRPWISSGIKVARVSESDLPSYLVQRVARLRSISKLSQAFIYFSLRHPAFTTHCGNRKTETTVPHISPHDIRSFPIPDLPEKVHQRFASAVDSLGRTTQHMRYAEQQSLALFNSLVQRAFRGEL